MRRRRSSDASATLASVLAERRLVSPDDLDPSLVVPARASGRLPVGAGLDPHGSTVASTQHPQSGDTLAASQERRASARLATSSEGSRAARVEATP